LAIHASPRAAVTPLLPALDARAFRLSPFAFRLAPPASAAAVAWRALQRIRAVTGTRRENWATERSALYAGRFQVATNIVFDAWSDDIAFSK
jgi:hypothetical protein